MPEQSESLTISVVVPVYNGEATIGSAIEHLLCQSLSPAEIIVVDDGSTDETANILRSFGSRIKVLSKTNGGPASARNEGARIANGGLIAFTDSDCFPSEDWLKELVKAFHSLEVGGAGGTVRNAGSGFIGQHVDLHGWMNPACGSDGKVLYLVTANACFRRDALLKANLFDERFRKPGGEDTEISVRLRSMGYEFAYVKTAAVWHRHRQTLRHQLKAIANHGEGQYLLERLWPELALKTNRGKEIVRTAAGLGSMFRFYRSYRQQHDRKRALFFSMLDHCEYIARIWGYHRGKRKLSNSLRRNPVTTAASTVADPIDDLGSGSILLPKA